jgi:hypothetical protein
MHESEETEKAASPAAFFAMPGNAVSGPGYLLAGRLLYRSCGRLARTHSGVMTQGKKTNQRGNTATAVNLKKKRHDRTPPARSVPCGSPPLEQRLNLQQQLG